MLVTGASQRIGAAIVRHAHSAGYRVIVHYRRSAEQAGNLVASLNAEREHSAVSLQADFANPETFERLIDAATAVWERLDVLVNNASEFSPAPVGSIGYAQLQETFTANVFAPLLLSQAALPALRRQRGAVINILDIYANRVHPDHTVYCASKAALSMITKSLAVECAPDVRVNGIAPGAILWPEGQIAVTDEAKAAMLEKIPLQRIGDAKQIALAVEYLCKADFVTGQTIAIDGGRTAL